ncbi:MAG: biotin--[acetyl-CoA-carboxylase] ligase [Chlamydiota bacterium]
MKIETRFFSKLDSTNLFAQREYSHFNPLYFTTIVADTQDNGIGRFQRKWISPPKKNIYATFVFRLPRHLSQLSRITQLLALTLVLLLEKKGLYPKIKWPNDLLLSQKKFCGILCQTQIEEDFQIFFLGFGINVNMTHFETIDQPATSLQKETNRRWNRKALLHSLQKDFIRNLKIFQQEGFSPFLADFDRRLLFKGEKISYFDGKTKWSGLFHGISPEGELILHLPSNEYKVFSAGEIL